MSTIRIEEFLGASIEDVVKVAPSTMVYAPGGTRRQAAFLGIEPWSEAYVHWAHERTLAACGLIFRHGVRHLLTPVYTPGNVQESNQHRQRIFSQIDWFLAGPESIAAYQRGGWRVRLIGAEQTPVLQATSERLSVMTPAHGQHTLYWTVAPDPESAWTSLLAAAQQSKATTRAALQRALYGEEIPPVTLYLAFGKPLFSFDLIPPLLVGQVQGYWSQQPGYSLTEAQLRTIFYDYAYLRPTWREDKLARAREALWHRQAWEEGPLLGVGMRLGPFWYPAPMSSPAWFHPPEQDGA
jgi:hypothetical protein